MRPASHPAIQNTLNLRFGFFLRYPNTNLQHFIIFFLGHRPDHPGKLYLVTDNRCCA
ncbi:TPA: hypothetical protein ACWQUH_002410 [Escherichia coli]|uniref:hypothetical protein n=1 Tax=Escherichia coli TaxID=562 RepID=UPI003CCFF730